MPWYTENSINGERSIHIYGKMCGIRNTKMKQLGTSAIALDCARVEQTQVTILYSGVKWRARFGRNNLGIFFFIWCHLIQWHCANIVFNCVNDQIDSILALRFAYNIHFVSFRFILVETTGLLLDNQTAKRAKVERKKRPKKKKNIESHVFSAIANISGCTANGFNSIAPIHVFSLWAVINVVKSSSYRRVHSSTNRSIQ